MAGKATQNGQGIITGRTNVFRSETLRRCRCVRPTPDQYFVDKGKQHANFFLGRADEKEARPLQDGGGMGKARYAVVSACSESTYKNLLCHRRRACANVLSQSLLQTSRANDMRGLGTLNSMSATLTQSNVSAHPTRQLPSSGRSSQQLKQ